MRLLYDTSILIAGFVTSHPKHQTALGWLQRAVKKEVAYLVSAHSLAECFAVLTKLPLSPRITPDIARHLLQKNVEKLAEIITLSSKDYLTLLNQLVKLGLTGGIVYDGIIVQAGKKAKADKILTLNAQDFIRLSPENPEFILAA